MAGGERSPADQQIRLSGDRRRRPLSFLLTPGQATDSPRFTAVLAMWKS